MATLRTIKRQLPKLFEQAERLREELDELADTIPTPTREEFFWMKHGHRLSAETYWLGVILAAYFCLEDIDDIAERHSLKIHHQIRLNPSRDWYLVGLVEAEIERRARESKEDGTSEPEDAED